MLIQDTVDFGTRNITKEKKRVLFACSPLNDTVTKMPLAICFEKIRHGFGAHL